LAQRTKYRCNFTRNWHRAKNADITSQEIGAEQKKKTYNLINPTSFMGTPNSIKKYFPPN
jgi:hypothetical protein